MQVLRPFQRYFDFSGRSGRPEYWWFVLFTWAGNSILQKLVGFITGSQVLVNAAAIIFGLATFIPSLSVGVRRFHDVGRSTSAFFLVAVPGWLLLGCGIAGLLMSSGPAFDPARQQFFLVVGGAAAVPGAAMVGWLIVQLVKKGDPGPNAFGDPDNAPAVRSSRKAPSAAPEPSNSMDSRLASLERLGQLHEKGLITDEEFAEQKRRVLE